VQQGSVLIGGYGVGLIDKRNDIAMPELLQRTMVLGMKASALCQKTGPQMDRKSFRWSDHIPRRREGSVVPQMLSCLETQNRIGRSTLTTVFGVLGNAPSGKYCPLTWAGKWPRPSIAPFLFLENFEVSAQRPKKE